MIFLASSIVSKYQPKSPFYLSRFSSLMTPNHPSSIPTIPLSLSILSPYRPLRLIRPPPLFPSLSLSASPTPAPDPASSRMSLHLHCTIRGWKNILCIYSLGVCKYDIYISLEHFSTSPMMDPPYSRHFAHSHPIPTPTSSSTLHPHAPHPLPRPHPYSPPDSRHRLNP